MHFNIRNPDTEFNFLHLWKIFSLSLCTRALNLKFKVIKHTQAEIEKKRKENMIHKECELNVKWMGLCFIPTETNTIYAIINVESLMSETKHVQRHF